MRVLPASILTLTLLCLGPAAVTAQDEAVPAPAPAVYFSGTFENTVTELPEPVLNPEVGLLEVRNGHIEFESTVSDPRIGNPYVIDPLHMDIDPQTGVGRMWGTGRLATDEGAFEGAIWGLHYPITEEVSGYTGSGWLTGSGAYEGLTYFYRGSFDGEQSVVEGIIYDGAAPPLE